MDITVFRKRNVEHNGIVCLRENEALKVKQRDRDSTGSREDRRRKETDRETKERLFRNMDSN